MAKSKIQKKQEASPNGHSPTEQTAQVLTGGTNNEVGDEKLSPFLKKQKAKLLQLRDSLLDAMLGVSRDTLRALAEGSEASAFGMHQTDAGSDAYDRDFALSLLSQEQYALYVFAEAFKRIDGGTYSLHM